MKSLAYFYWIGKKVQVFSILVMPKIALYSKARINFPIKRDSELCHSGNLSPGFRSMLVLRTRPCFWELLLHHCHQCAVQDPSTAPVPSHVADSSTSIWSFIYLFIVNLSLELRKLISFFPVVELIRNIALFPTKANRKMSICLGSQHSPSWSGPECFWTICHRLRLS